MLELVSSEQGVSPGKESVWGCSVNGGVKDLGTGNSGLTGRDWALRGCERSGEPEAQVQSVAILTRPLVRPKSLGLLQG